MKKKYLKPYFLLILFSIGMPACTKVNVDAPKDRIVTSSLFKDDASATAAVLGLYAQMSDPSFPFSAGATTIYTGLSADELSYNGQDNATKQFATNSLTASNSIVASNLWRFTYSIIYQANACIEGLSSSSSITPALKSQLTGEAYFVRAFCYWYFSNLFGDVPLILGTEDYEANAKLPRTSAATIQDKVVADLKQAVTLLSKDYPSAGRLRPNYYTALTLLSRVYLYQQKWQLSADAATEVINSGIYSIESNLNSIFITPSNEAIWQLATDVTGINTPEGNRLIPNTFFAAVPQYPVNSNFLNAFEAGDKRKSSWIALLTVKGTTYPYTYKYKVRYNTNKTESLVVFRLAELYLNRAEAKAHLSDFTGAASDLNVTRNRAGLSGLSFGDQTSSLNAIMKERRFEFFMEWGTRWFDLKRTGTINNVLGPLKANWKPEYALFPIPKTELISNSNLTQNPGYQ